MENPCRSCKLANYAMFQVLYTPPAAFLTTIRGDYGHHFGGRSAFAAWTNYAMCPSLFFTPTAAIPMENPCRSCKLTPP